MVGGRGELKDGARQATVVVRCVYEPHALLRECLDGLLAQKGIEPEILVIDSSGSASERSAAERDGRVRYVHLESTGLSEGRNKGLELAEHNYVAFTDPDCLVAVDWLVELVQALEAGAAIAGGKIVPRWLEPPPDYLRKSAVARTQLSLLDLSDVAIDTSRVFGANFALNRPALGDEAYFRQGLGRQAGLLISGEETELCVRALARGHRVRYTPHAVVEHQIPPPRLRFSWMARRMHYGGISRVLQGGLPDPVVKTYSAYDYLFLLLFLAPYLAGLVRGGWIKSRLSRS